MQQRLAGPAAAVNQGCHGNVSGVSGHDQHVVANPKVVLIYWDQYFTTMPSAVSETNRFVTDLLGGTYIDGLRQYGINRGSLQASFVIDMSAFPTPNSRNPGAAFSESPMQEQLIAWLDANAVSPAPAGDETSLVYLIFAPSDTTLSLRTSEGVITSGFCGYHQHGKRRAIGQDDNLFWGTVHGYDKSSSEKVFVDSISYCVSHELVEAFSNRDDRGFFTDDGNGCEIGDLCEAPAGSDTAVTVPFGQWQVESYWSQKDRTCISSLAQAYKIVSVSSGKVLDVPAFATGDGVIIQQFTDNGGTNQQWRFFFAGDGQFKIVSVSSNKVLDVPAFATNDGALIQQFTDNGGANQH
jgi:hypothetical protein